MFQKVSIPVPQVGQEMLLTMPHMINGWFVCLDLSDCFVSDLFIKLINHSTIVLPYNKYVISYVLYIVLHVEEMDVFIGMYVLTATCILMGRESQHWNKTD